MSKGLEIIHRFQNDDIRNIQEYKIIEKELKALDFIREEIEFGFEIVNNQTRLTLTARGVKVMSITIDKEKYDLLKEVLKYE